MQIDEIEVVAQPFAALERECQFNPAELQKTLGDAFPKLHPEFIAQGLGFAGPPLVMYNFAADGSTRLFIGAPVSAEDAANAKDPLHRHDIPAGNAYKFVHKGPYEDLHKSYEAAMPILMQKGVKPMEATCWEVYVNDPAETAPEDLITQVYFQTG